MLDGDKARDWIRTFYPSYPYPLIGFDVDFRPFLSFLRLTAGAPQSDISDWKRWEF